MTFEPTYVEVTCVTLPKDHCVQVPWKYIKICGYSDPFCENLNQRSLTPRWLLTPHLLRSHVWLYPRIIVSKSHGNTSMYVDTVINFANYHIHTHTTYILRTTYIPHIESVITQSQARQQKPEIVFKYSKRIIWAYSFCRNKGDGFLSFLKAFSWETDLWVTLGYFTVKNAKLGRHIRI